MAKKAAPREPADRTIAVAIVPAVAGATVNIQVSNDPPLWLRGTTSDDGYVAWQWSDALGDSVLDITADGYEEYIQSIHWKTYTDPDVGAPPLNHQVTVGGDLPPLEASVPAGGGGGGLPIVTPPQPSAPGEPCQALSRDGVTIRNAAGQRISLCGYDMFTAIRMLLDGINLQPFIEESLHYGFNLWRVFGMASSKQNGYYTLSPSEPGYYDKLEQLVQRLSSVGIYLLHTTYADCQDIGFDLGVWTNVANVLRPYQHAVFLSGGNEYSKNYWDPMALPDPGMQWWSRGSNIGDAAPPYPTGTFCEFHPRRDYPKALDDTIASQTWIQYHDHANVPLIIDEPPRVGEDGSGAEYTDPGIVWRFARSYSGGCAGAVCHMRPGQKGALIVPGSLNDTIATAWQIGMQLA